MSFNDLWSNEENRRQSEQLIQWLDGLPSSISTLLPFKKMSHMGLDRTQCHFVGLLGAHLSFWWGTFILHISLRVCFLSQRLPAWVKMNSLLLLIGAVSLPSVYTGTTFLSSPGFSTEYIDKNKNLKLPKTLKNWSKNANNSFLKKTKKDNCLFRCLLNLVPAGAAPPRGPPSVWLWS